MSEINLSKDTAEHLSHWLSNSSIRRLRVAYAQEAYKTIRGVLLEQLAHRKVQKFFCIEDYRRFDGIVTNGEWAISVCRLLREYPEIRKLVYNFDNEKTGISTCFSKEFLESYQTREEASQWLIKAAYLGDVEKLESELAKEDVWINAVWINADEVNPVRHFGIRDVYIRRTTALGAAAMVERGSSSEESFYIDQLSKKFQCAELVLKNGADPDHIDEEGVSVGLRLVAGKEERVEFVRPLIEADANLDMFFSFKKQATMLMKAVSSELVESVKLLLDSGAEVNRSTKPHYTPLMAAASKPRIIEMLVNFGADIKVKDICGKSALHHAASCGCTGSIGVLIENQAHINLRDNEGLTPLDRAIMGGHEDAIRVLEEHGAESSFFLDDGDE